MADRSEFFQQGPSLANPYRDDRLLRAHLQRVMPDDVMRAIEPELHELGERVLGDIWEMGMDAELNPPRLVQYDPWGRRIDRIDVAPGWEQLGAVAAREGLVAIAYERAFGELSRIHQFAKMYLFHPSSMIYTCPIAMSDGAARLIELEGDAALRQRALRRLTSRDPDQCWISGQWMTERAGGSDVARTETVARPDGDGYRLYGTKWFTSAATAQMAVALARIEGPDGRVVDGSPGLSTFYLEVRDEGCALNGVTIHRLKDKLGSKALPTAELSLDGTRARLIGEPGAGVRNIARQFNITRIHNSLAAAADMRRIIALVRDYARRRQAFGRDLIDLPLYAQVLADMEVECQGAFHLCFHLIQLLGKEETGTATADELAVLRLLTPLAKLYTAKQGVAVASEGLECIGGAAYVEDTGLPRHYRDALVLAIWEGTTNVLSLDALRAMRREDALEPFLANVARQLEGVASREVGPEVERVRQAMAAVRDFLAKVTDQEPACAEAAARDIAVSLARISIAALLLEFGSWLQTSSGDRQGVLAARRWCGKTLVPSLRPDAEQRAETRALAAG